MNNLTTERLYHNLNDEQLKCLEKLETCEEFNQINMLRRKISKLYKAINSSNFYLKTESLVKEKIASSNPNVSQHWKSYRMIEQKHLAILKKHFNVQIINIEKSNEYKIRAENLKAQISEFTL
jgi:hypothetical protein